MLFLSAIARTCSKRLSSRNQSSRDDPTCRLDVLISCPLDPSGAKASLAKPGFDPESCDCQFANVFHQGANMIEIVLGPPQQIDVHFQPGDRRPPGRQQQCALEAESLGMRHAKGDTGTAPSRRTSELLGTVFLGACNIQQGLTD